MNLKKEYKDNIREKRKNFKNFEEKYINFLSNIKKQIHDFLDETKKEWSREKFIDFEISLKEVNEEIERLKKLAGFIEKKKTLKKLPSNSKIVNKFKKYKKEKNNRYL